jgi:hypothetical protein
MKILDFKKKYEWVKGIYPDLIAYIILAIILGIYTYIEVVNYTTAYQEVDPDGYLILAKQIARLKPLAVKDDDPFIYQSHVWVENEDGEVAPKFAPGYPFLMSIAYLLGGDWAMFLVSPIMGGLGLIGSYFLFRLWMSRVAALAGVFCLATNAMVLVYSGYLLTHASDMCLAVWGMFFLWRWLRGMGKFSGLGAGLMLGGAMTIRHTSYLLVLPLIAVIVVKWIEYLRKRDVSKKLVKDTLILLASYGFFPLILMLYNWSIFDSPFTTGYGLTGEQWEFAWKNIPKNTQILGVGLNITALYLLFPIGLAGMLLFGSKGEIITRFLWVIPSCILYAAYYWAMDSMAYFRFLIGIFPAIVGSAFALMDRANSSWRIKAIGFILLSAFIIFVRYDATKSSMKGTVSDLPSRSLAYSARRASKVLNDDAVIFSQRPIFCYMGTCQNFRLYDLEAFTKSYGSNAFKPGITPLRQPERNNRLREFYSNLSDADLLMKKKELIKSFISSSRQVVYLLREEAAKAEQGQLGEVFQWKLIDEWDMYPKNVGGKWPAERWGLYEITMKPD